MTAGELSRPEGDPDQIEQFAARLVKAGTATGDAADGIRQQTVQVSEHAQWAGAAADAYGGFTAGLSRSVGALADPLTQAARPLRDFAGSLRTAQQRVDAYSDAYHRQYPLAAGGAPAGQDLPMVDIQLAELYDRAEQALAAYQAQAGITARALGIISEQMTRDFFGPEGPFRSFLEKAHLPWDAVAGDALIENFIKGGEKAEEAIRSSEELPEAIEKLMDKLVEPVADEIEATIGAGTADARTNLKVLLQALENYQLKKGETIAAVEKALEESDPELARNLGSLKTVAAEMDVIGLLAGVYTVISPPADDKGAWRAADRLAGVGVAAGSSVSIAQNAFNVDFGGLSLGPLDSLEFVPDVGLVIAVAGGIYMTADWVIHHPQEAHYILDHPMTAGCNLLGNMFGKQIWEQSGCAPPPPPI